MKITIKNIPLVFSLLALPMTAFAEDTIKKETTPEQAKAEKAVKSSLQQFVENSSAQLMIQLPDHLELGAVIFDMPKKLEGLKLVKVSITYSLVAAHDLYLKKSVLSELVEAPTVIEQEYAKGAQVDYMKVRYVVKSDGKGSYEPVQEHGIKSDYKNLKSKAKSSFGTNILVYGSDEHMAAAKRVAEIKAAKKTDK